MQNTNIQFNTQTYNTVYKAYNTAQNIQYSTKHTIQHITVQKAYKYQFFYYDKIYFFIHLVKLC